MLSPSNPPGAAELKHYFAIIGTSGTGKSYSSILMKQKARDEGHLYICTDSYNSSKGLFPLEHVLAGRIVHGVSGKRPRSKNLRLPRSYSIGEIAIKHTKKKRPQIHPVHTKNATLTRKLISEAISELASATGVYLNHPQMIELLENYNLDAEIEKLGDIDTVIRENISEALALHLIDRPWFNYDSDEDADEFFKKIESAAISKGYKV